MITILIALLALVIAVFGCAWLKPGDAGTGALEGTENRDKVSARKTCLGSDADLT